jgi:hypothetical protein
MMLRRRDRPLSKDKSKSKQRLLVQRSLRKRRMRKKSGSCFLRSSPVRFKRRISSARRKPRSSREKKL